MIKPDEVLRRSAGETGYYGSSTALVAHFDGQVISLLFSQHLKLISSFNFKQVNIICLVEDE